MPNNYIYDIDGDKEGNVYVGTYQGGISHFRGKEIIDVHHIIDSKAEMYDILVSHDQSLYVSLEKLYKLDLNPRTNKLKEKRIVYNSQVKRMSQIKPNFMSFTNGSSVYIWELGQDSMYLYPTLYSHNNVKAYNILYKNDYELYIGTTNGVYNLLFPINDDLPKTQKVTKRGEDLALKSNIRYVVDKKITKKQYFNLIPIDIFEEDTYKKEIFKDSTSIDYYISDMQKTSDGSIWISTYKNGVYRIKDHKIIKHYTESIKELTSNLCNRLFIDKQDRVWVATMRGISLIDYPRGMIRKITTDDGLVSNHITSIFKHDSLIYVGTSEGLNILDEKSVSSLNSAPPILIEEVKINEKNVPLKGQYKLKHNENSLYFKFNSISYNQKITYKYRIKNLDDKWLYTKDNYIRIPKIPKGKYVFEVKSINKDGLESLEKAQVFLQIKPHILYSFWAYLTYAILLILSVLAFVYFNIKRVRDKEQLNTQMAELEIKALQSQMNPHFVFNSMNAIQAYIFKNETEKASSYLSDFSTLIRSFLELSRKTFISLGQSLEAVQLYIKLEQMRTEDKFDFVLDIAPDVEMDIEIPTIVLQPFVENAIVHGLLNKKEKGILRIILQKKNEYNLIIRIEDNGIGREASKALKQNKQRKHPSRGMQIVEEHLNVLSKNKDYNLQIDIIDNVLDGSGTIVIMNLPID